MCIKTLWSRQTYHALCEEIYVVGIRYERHDVELDKRWGLQCVGRVTLRWKEEGERKWTTPYNPGELSSCCSPAHHPATTGYSKANLTGVASRSVIKRLTFHRLLHLPLGWSLHYSLAFDIPSQGSSLGHSATDWCFYRAAQIRHRYAARPSYDALSLHLQRRLARVHHTFHMCHARMCIPKGRVGRLAWCLLAEKTLQCGRRGDLRRANRGEGRLYR